MKISTLVMVAAFTVGCTTTGERIKERLVESGETCNTMCKNNPEVGEFSYTAGGGFTLLFMGNEEVTCNCNRTQK